MVEICLLEPEGPENIGLIARVMKNFGFSKLVLINPKCKIDDSAVSRAMHAKDVLKKARIIKNIKQLKNKTIIGTTGKLGSSYNVRRLPLTPKELKTKINKKSGIVLLFGRESHGLTNQELEKCDFVLTIPCSKKYPVLNISHAVAIVLYEISSIKKEKAFEPASKNESKAVIDYFNRILSKLKFEKQERKKTIKQVIRNLVNKSFLRKREAYTMCGFLKRLFNSLKK